MLTVIKVNSNYWKAFIIKVGDPTPKGNWCVALYY